MSSENNENSVPTDGNYVDDMKKYTKIDNLDEDQVVDSGKFFLVSFISPEGVMNCKMRGLKIRTYKNRVVYPTLEEAKAAADEINQKDKYFHVFVGETGKWMGWDPSPDDRNLVAEEHWADKDQNEIMQKMREREETNLNELNALVGKKKAMVDKDKKKHKKRIADTLKESVANVKASKENKNKDESEQKSETTENITTNNDDIPKEVMTEEQVKEEQNKMLNTAKKQHNPRLVKERLRQKLNEKNKSDKSDLMKELKDTQVKDSLTTELSATTETKTKLDENIKKLTNILNKAKQSETEKKSE
jgi:hypothetical protein